MKDDLKQLQKKEAIKRLEILQSEYGLPEYVVKEFVKSETKYYSEHNTYIDKWKVKEISKDDYFQNAVIEFEKNNNALVYYAIFETSVDGGLELEMLYVSEEKCDWDKDKEELTNGEPALYFKNFDDDERTGEFYYNLKKYCGGRLWKE